MAVALLSIPESLSAEQYDRVMNQLEASGAGAPPGRRFHACFGSGHRLTVFDVWESVEEFQAFATTLMPILAKAQVGMAPVEPLTIHNLILGGDASTLSKTTETDRNQAPCANDPQLYG